MSQRGGGRMQGMGGTCMFSGQKWEVNAPKEGKGRHLWADIERREERRKRRAGEREERRRERKRQR